MLHTLLYFLALFALSTSSNLAKLNHMPVEILGLYRLSFAAILVFLWLLIKKPASLPKPDKKLAWAVLSGFFFFIHLFTFKYAAKNTSISNTMIIFSSNPIWASLGAILFFRDKLEKRLIFAYLMALIGVYILVADGLHLTSISSHGNWSALISAFFYAAYMLTGKKARQYFDNTVYAFIQYLICALFFAITALGTGADLTHYGAISWLSVLGLVLLPTFLGHFSFTYLVKHMDISLMSCGKLIEPMMASVIAYFVFHENMKQNSWLAFMFTSSSVLILFAPSLFKTVKNKLS